MIWNPFLLIKLEKQGRKEIKSCLPQRALSARDETRSTFSAHSLTPSLARSFIHSVHLISAISIFLCDSVVRIHLFRLTFNSIITRYQVGVGRIVQRIGVRVSLEYKLNDKIREIATLRSFSSAETCRPATILDFIIGTHINNVN